jgi:small conductance mechanosensitive channel
MSIEAIVPFLINLLLALLTFGIGLLIANAVGTGVRRYGESKENLDNTIAAFFGSLTRYGILALTLVAVLDRFGVETTSLVALIGSAGLAIGLALQGTLSDLACGVMLIFFRPFKVGSFVIAGGQTGTVREIGLFATELTTPDNVQIILPNSKIWGSPITNFSAHPVRRVDLVFGVSYYTDLKVAEASIRAVIAGDERVKQEPAEPFVAVSELADCSVNFTVRVWCASADYANLKFALTRAVKERFDADGVEIPFPTRTMNGVLVTRSE